MTQVLRRAKMKLRAIHRLHAAGFRASRASRSAQERTSEPDAGPDAGPDAEPDAGATPAEMA